MIGKVRTGRGTYSRRGLLKTSVAGSAGLAALTLVACGSDSDKKESTGASASPASGAATQAAAASATPTPRTGGDFKMATRTFDISLDPHFTTRPELIYVWQAISHPLLELGADGLLNAGAARSWENPDPQTFVARLAPGITFHNLPPANGRPFTADDVKFSIERIRSQGAPRASLLSVVDTVTATAPDTVTFKLKQPNAPLLFYLASGYQVMVNREAVEKFGDLKSKDAAIGIGPFVVDQLGLDTGAKLKRNPNYFRQGQPYFDSLEFIPLRDQEVGLVNAFRAGQSELAPLKSRDLDQVKGQYKDIASVKAGNGGALFGLIFNQAKTPWNDARVRRAVSLVIDRQAIGESAFQKDAFMITPVPAPLTPYSIPDADLLNMPGYRKDKAADLAEAKKLLQAAGMANDFKDLEINLSSSTAPNYTEQWEVLVPQLQRAGAKVNVKPMEHAAFKAAEPRKEWEVEFTGFGVDSEPDSTLSLIHHSKGSRNLTNAPASPVDDLIDKQRVELNRDARIKLCRDASTKLIEDAMYAWTAYSWFNMTYHNYVKNLTLLPLDGFGYETNFWPAWIDKG